MFVGPISGASSASLRPGRQRHGHLGAAPVAGARSEGRRPGLLPVLQRERRTRLEDCQQQACSQNQVAGTDELKHCLRMFSRHLSVLEEE